MIELRVLQRKISRQRGIDDGIYQPPLPDFVIVEVLQYRRGSYPYQPPHETEWVGTPWIDVERVEE